MEYLDKLKEKYSRLFKELREDSISFHSNNIEKLTKDYLDKIEYEIRDKGIYYRPEKGIITVPIGKCETEMCKELSDKIIDKNIKEVLGPGFKLNRKIYIRNECGSIPNKMLALAGVPMRCTEIYEFDYEIEWE